MIFKLFIFFSLLILSSLLVDCAMVLLGIFSAILLSLLCGGALTAVAVGLFTERDDFWNL